ncbi:hypothetical protein U91I_02096 [alpha proteobacterium U9-1i]|nr:hypothetical protein U91I_02096 [alpha proteobacterium U9-1i]
MILAHLPGADADVEEIAAQLARLGYAIDRDVTAPGASAARTRAKRIAAAHRYVVLWSREGAKTPALRAAAKHALRAGKLAGVRLDRTPPPVGGADAISLPRGRAQAHAWRRLLEYTDMPAATAAADARARQPTSRITALVAVLLMSLVAGTAGYFSSPSFAATLDGVAAKAQAMMSDIAG